MKTILTVLLLMFVFSCSNNDRELTLQEKALELKERELALEEERAEAGDKELETNESNADFTLEYDSYYNNKFEFCISYPTNYMVEIGESDAKDGNVFQTPNGDSEIRGYAMFNVLDETISDHYATSIEGGVYYDLARIVTYHDQKKNWYVVSGQNKNKIFYAKTILKDETFYTVFIEYPKSEKKRFDQIIKKVTKNFPNCN